MQFLGDGLGRHAADIHHRDLHFARGQWKQGRSAFDVALRPARLLPFVENLRLDLGIQALYGFFQH
jgi:hypothetical protein